MTVDEKLVQLNETHRRPGVHVDGVFKSTGGSWGGGGWGSVGNGMLTVSSHTGCKAWNQTIIGWPGSEGECDHLTNQLQEENSVLFEPNKAFWVDGLCVHESLPMKTPTSRQFVRVSMPSNSPWFEGYTQNPKGIVPTGPILPQRIFMKA